MSGWPSPKQFQLCGPHHQGARAPSMLRLPVLQVRYESLPRWGNSEVDHESSSRQTRHRISFLLDVNFFRCQWSRLLWSSRNPTLRRRNLMIRLLLRRDGPSWFGLQQKGGTWDLGILILFGIRNYRQSKPPRPPTADMAMSFDRVQEGLA